MTELLRLIYSMTRLVDEMIKTTERAISETEDNMLKDAYGDYLRDIREIAGTLGKITGKMAADRIIDPREAIAWVGRKE